jgi:cytochrome b involved in lipid metabolism
MLSGIKLGTLTLSSTRQVVLSPVRPQQPLASPPSPREYLFGPLPLTLVNLVGLRKANRHLRLIFLRVNKTRLNMSADKDFTYAQVAEHSTKKDLYLVIHDKVYNTTAFVDEHP